MQVVNKNESKVVVLSKDEICFTKRVLYASVNHCNESLEPFAVDLKRLNFHDISVNHTYDFIMIYNLKTKESTILPVQQGREYLFDIKGEVLTWKQFYDKCDRAGRKIKQLLGL